jgi:1-pyrroline-5-carboxylate dehydrogenase
MGAVIDEKSWTKLDGAIQEVRNGGSAELVAGGSTAKSKGYFIWPTLVQANDLDCRVMNEELFGPIVGAYVYSDERYEEIARLIDQKSAYGLTGAVFATDRKAIMLAADILRNAAGNFYINDKPTGAVVGQQPFGGARASGTNDKAGSMWNLARWMSPRSVKEMSVPATDYRYRYMET